MVIFRYDGNSVRRESPINESYLTVGSLVTLPSFRSEVAYLTLFKIKEVTKDKGDTYVDVFRVGDTMMIKVD
jgi:hypothetical protein